MLHIEEEVVRLAHTVFKPATRRRKEGWSPRIQTITIALQHIVRIKRHTFGHHNYTLWTENSYRRGLHLVLKSWRSALTNLAIPDPDAEDPFPPSLDLDSSPYRLGTWAARSLPDLRHCIIPAFQSLKSMLHGNIRVTSRREFGGLMSRLQVECSAGRIRTCIKVVMTAKQRRPYTM
jgi:hypothetical protein